MLLLIPASLKHEMIGLPKDFELIGNATASARSASQCTGSRA
jgi:hypothetical protein